MCNDIALSKNEPAISTFKKGYPKVEEVPTTSICYGTRVTIIIHALKCSEPGDRDSLTCYFG